MQISIGIDVGGTKTRIASSIVISSSALFIIAKRLRLYRLWSQNYSDKDFMGFIVFPTPTASQPILTYSVAKLQKFSFHTFCKQSTNITRRCSFCRHCPGAISFAGIVKANAVIIKAADLYYGWGDGMKPIFI